MGTENKVTLPTCVLLSHLEKYEIFWHLERDLRLIFAPNTDTFLSNNTTVTAHKLLRRAVPNNYLAIIFSISRLI